MKNNGYEISKKFYKNLERFVIVFLVGLIATITGFIGWYIFKNPILMLIGWVIAVLAILSGFVVFFYVAYLFIRLLFAKWPRRD
ncbi:MAG: hypothetical protein LBL65_07580 [Campylobacteraceae bacterium]|jgi:hypothetical protein|nr:hypothetical protein [Campylobacteraceae bacterium]